MIISHSIDFVTKKVFVTLVSIIIFTAVDCKDEPTKPPVTEQPQDTTSHNFVVTRVDTLGDWFSTAFCVDIADENNIWVGGEFTTKDSASNYRNFTHNLAKWDGEKWTKSKVEFIGWNNTGPSIQIIGGIRVFSDSSVFSVAQYDNSIAWWNGKKWLSTYVNEAVVSPHFWARSLDDSYFVSNEGRTTHFNGETFTKMSTGITNPPFIDIWGDENQVYTIGKPEDINRDGTLYMMLYTNSTSNWEIFNTFPVFDSIPKPPNINLGGLTSIYRASSKSKLWVLGGGAVREITSIKPFAVKNIFTIPYDFYSKLIRGNKDNDLFLFGEVGDKVWHFNGKSWKIIDAPQDFLLLSAAVKNNIIVLVGATPGGIATQGIVVTLKRF